MAEIKCERCQSSLSGDEVNIHTGLAKCSHCGTVFMIVRPQRNNAPVDEYYNNEFKNVEKPAGVRVNRSGNSVTIEKKQNMIIGMFLLVFALMWNGALSIGINSLMSSTNTLTVLLPILPFLLIGCGMLYWGLSFLINRLYITIYQGELKLYQAPMPFPGKKTVKRGEIKQLFVKETMHRRSSTSSTTGSSRSSYYATYDLMIIKTSGKRFKLISLENPEIALFFEQSIEEFLGIRDEHIAGEITQ